MTVFFLTLGLMVLVMAGLAIGVLSGREPLRGSCGGDRALRMCPVCNEEEEK